MSLFISLILILCSLPLIVILWGNFCRWPKHPKELVPNCLLTKSPVIFVTGPRSLFYFRHYWNDLPPYLVAHGYDVRLLRLPWSNQKQRQEWADRLLREAPSHLIMDLPTSEELAPFLPRWPLHSIHIPKAQSDFVSPANRAIFLLHQFWLEKRGVRAPRAADLGLGPGTHLQQELLGMIRLQAEREWIQALSSPQIPIEPPDKA